MEYLVWREKKKREEEKGGDKKVKKNKINFMLNQIL